MEQSKSSDPPRLSDLDAFWALFVDLPLRFAAQDAVDQWTKLSHPHRLGPNHVVLEAAGPSVGGLRTVVTIYADGRVLVPFNSYAGTNSGIPIPTLMTEDFRRSADSLFGFNGSERQARTAPRLANARECRSTPSILRASG